MKRLFNHPAFLFLLRVCIASVFIYAGLSKFRDPQSLADSVSTFRVLPNATINLLALTLPPFEIILGLLVFGRWNRRPALLGLLLIITIFLMALGQAYFRGIEVSCGCFGPGEASSMATSFVRDLILFAIVLFLCYLEYLGRYLPETT